MGVLDHEGKVREGSRDIQLVVIGKGMVLEEMSLDDRGDRMGVENEK